MNLNKKYTFKDLFLKTEKFEKGGFSEKVDIRFFKRWISEGIFDYAHQYSTKKNEISKNLAVDFQGNIYVNVNGELKYRGISPEKAVEIYNSY